MGFKKINITSNSSAIGKFLIYCFGLFFIVGIVYSYSQIQNVFSENPNDPTSSDKPGISFPIIWGKNPEKENEKEDKNKKITNILVTGRGGILNDAPNLTDTILMASINDFNKTITMISIPRDLYVDYGIGKGKINEVYSANLRNNSIPESMYKLADKIEEITGLEADYFIDLDFQGFIKLIDEVGGVSVNVEKDLYDNEYPDGNLGYTVFSIKKGIHNLNGEIALKYARSRHSTSDFDRSLRQQQIISAVRDKIIDNGYLSSPQKMAEMYNVFTNYVKTDFTIGNALSYRQNLLNIKDYQIFSLNFNDTCYLGIIDQCKTGGFLYVPLREKFGGSSVLLFDETTENSLSNYDKIQKFIKTVFANPEFLKEEIPLTIISSNNNAFYLKEEVLELKKYGFNANQRYKLSSDDREMGIFYENIDEDNYTLKMLKDFYPELELVNVSVEESSVNRPMDITTNGELGEIPENIGNSSENSEIVEEVKNPKIEIILPRENFYFN